MEPHIHNYLYSKYKFFVLDIFVCWDDPQFQVTNCSFCGDYIISNSLGNNLPKNIVCKCKNYSDYYSDEDY